MGLTLPLWKERTKAGATAGETRQEETPGDVVSCRHGLGRLGEEAGRSIWSGHALSCLVVAVESSADGDRRPGDEGGDAIRRAVAGLLARTVRSSDVVAWIEDEQFLIIAPEANAKAAQAMANRLLAKLRRHRVTTASGEKVRLTATIGIASCAGGPVSEPFDLVERACEAVGRGREGGGNQIVSG
jgi:diguanylate cyclase (GGDEF)-like protein